ncbi:MAG: tagatose-6-phosphate kinase [Cyclobacteriaceae bacterium]|nr:MAG: tagatose-6-phosphate kinase [Cyclobacteriaceae bacterium]
MILVVCPNPSVDTFMKIDAFKPSAVNRALSEEHYPGGKGVHVALAIAEYGEQVCLLGFWGGPTGSWIKQQCIAQGVECVGPVLTQLNRFCITINQPGSFNETELLGTGPLIQKEHLDECYKVFESKLSEASIVVVSGSLPPQCPVDFYHNLIKRAHVRGRKCLIDTTGEVLKVALDAKPFGVHLNEQESQQATGTSDIKGIVERLGDQITLKIITQGAKGLFFAKYGDMLHANVALDKVFSTVGSGDCLMAGVAIAICKGYDNKKTAKLAVAFGAANCLRKELGMLFKKDIESLIPQVVVNKPSVQYG